MAQLRLARSTYTALVNHMMFIKKYLSRKTHNAWTQRISQVLGNTILKDWRLEQKEDGSVSLERLQTPMIRYRCLSKETYQGLDITEEESRLTNLETIAYQLSLILEQQIGVPARKGSKRENQAFLQVQVDTTQPTTLKAKDTFYRISKITEHLCINQNVKNEVLKFQRLTHRDLANTCHQANSATCSCTSIRQEQAKDSAAEWKQAKLEVHSEASRKHQREEQRKLQETTENTLAKRSPPRRHDQKRKTKQEASLPTSNEDQL